jgi:polyvinyl alcohol dehydrogenase (cytochrome)
MRSSRNRRCAGTVVAALLFALPAAAASRPVAQSPSQPPVPVNGRESSRDWPKYCHDLAMSGFSSGEERITRATAPGLTLLWSRPLSGSVASSPTVVAGTVYVGDWGGHEWAISAATGEPLATADLGTTMDSGCNPPALGITSAPTASGDQLYLAGGDDSFYALDRSTLSVLWKKVLGDNSPPPEGDPEGVGGGYYGWCSPAMADGKLLQGISSNCDHPFIPGRLVSLDPPTGTLLEDSLFSPPNAPSRNGAGVWTSPAVDLPARKVFVTTGSAYHYGDGLAYSLVRLSLDGLAVEDHWRVVLNKFFDADWGSSPTLFEDSDGRKLVGAGQKDGDYYAFDRDDLSSGPLWRAIVARPGDCPQCGDGTLSTAAFDGRRLYVGGGALPDGSAPGSVVALDPAGGAVLWRYAGFDGPVIAPVSAIEGVVFAVGGHDVVALSGARGDLLWSYRMTGWGYGGIAVSDGRIFLGDLAGNLYAFGLE